MRQKLKHGILWLVVLLPGVWSMAKAEEPVLWQGSTFHLQQLNEADKSAVADLLKRANKALLEPSHAIPVLASAGKTDKSNPALLASRKAFQDADRIAVLALAYRLSQDPRYLNQARAVLLDWARINHPTGQPIDEARLEGMVWGYDLIRASLSAQDKAHIEGWLEQMREKKNAWQLGPNALVNNHHTQQLKMLLLLDKVLRREEAWKMDLENAKKLAGVNLNPVSGSSKDYEQRDALFYHNYDLQAWLEIGLVTGCCQENINRAFHFLVERIRSGRLSGEFVHSTAEIDLVRGEQGFDYAKKGGTFELERAAPTIISYYTLRKEQPPGDLWGVAEEAKPSGWVAFLRVRRVVFRGGLND